MLEDFKFNLDDWTCKKCSGTGRIRYKNKESQALMGNIEWDSYTFPCVYCDGTGWIEIDYEDTDDETD